MKRNLILVLASLSAAVGAAAQAPPTILNGPAAGDLFGTLISALGDTDGDGQAEIIIGGPGNTNGGGKVQVVTAGTRAVRHSFAGNGVSEQIGWSAAGIGDVDGDGRPDFAVGAPGFYPFGGRIRVYSGAAGNQLYQVASPGIGDLFGWALAPAGDVNQDGVPDFVCGTPWDGTAGLYAGRVDVRSGATGAVLRTVFAAASYDALGYTVAGAGDVDGDLVPDILAGATGTGGMSHHPNQPQSGIGYVNLYSGATGALIRSFSTGVAFDGCGGVLAATDDVDGDGGGDLAIVLAPPGSPAMVQVLSGATFAVIHQWTNPAQDRWASVAGAGDVDGDGTPDLVIGSSGFDVPPRYDVGVIQIRSGATGAVLFQIAGTGVQDFLGATVAGAGDLDGDGHADVIAGAPYDSNTGVSSGGILVFRGMTAPLADLRPVGIGTVSQPLPTLSGSQQPVLGLTMTLSVANGGAFAPGVLGVADGPVTTTSVPGFGFVHVNLSPAANPLFFPFRTDATGAWTAAVPVPADPALVARDFTLQAASFPSVGPARATNALYATIGY